MGHRSVTRLAAVLALGIVVAGVVAIVSANHGGRGGGATTSSTTHAFSTRPRRHGAYFVKPGDTLSKIALMAGVPLGRLEGMNPRAAPPATVTVGQRIWLGR